MVVSSFVNSNIVIYTIKIGRDFFDVQYIYPFIGFTNGNWNLDKQTGLPKKY